MSAEAGPSLSPQEKRRKRLFRAGCMRQWIWRHYICGEHSLAEVGVRSSRVSSRVWPLARDLAKLQEKSRGNVSDKFGQENCVILRKSRKTSIFGGCS